EFSSEVRIDDVQFALGNADGALNRFFTDEVRGTLIRFHLWDKETGDLQENAFIGLLAAFDMQLDQVACTATQVNVAAFDDVAPRSKITLTDFPKAPSDPLPGSGGRGSTGIVPSGIGIGRHIPARYCRAPMAAGDPDFWDYILGVGNLGVDYLWTLGATVPQDTIGDQTQFEFLYREYA